jgi:hypothetical protein
MANSVTGQNHKGWATNIGDPITDIEVRNTFTQRGDRTDALDT